MAFIVINPNQVDPKSPVDDDLMGAIKQDLDDLDARFVGVTAPFVFSVQGRLRTAAAYKRAVDIVPMFKEYSPTVARVSLRVSGISGALSFDIRKVAQTNTPILSVLPQFSDSTQSVANIAPNHATQSITRTTAQIATQSVSFAKAAINVTSIINVGGNFWRYNLASAPDSFAIVGKSVTITGATAPANNITAPIVEVNASGHPSIVVSNPSGVAQTSAAGSLQLNLMSFNFINPVSAQFSVGESALFAGHTSATNDGTLAIAAVNNGGNNLWAYVTTGVAQGGVGGNVNVQRFSYNLLGAASADLVVGEKAKMSGHTTGANNGNFTITALNNIGNNVQVYNSAGTTQGGVAGIVDTNRWIYSFLTDPAADISVGYNVIMSGHTSAANNGTFDVREVKHNVLTNIVIYNESGVFQAGAVGTVYTGRRIVSFSSDQSAIYSTDSYIEMQNLPSGFYNASKFLSPFRVLQVNRGGGANYNLVIESLTGDNVLSPAGFVLCEMKSIFNAAPSFSADVVGITAGEYQQEVTTDFIPATIDEGTQLQLFLLSIPGGSPEDLSITLY
jgi:hypothetical protein